MELKVWVDGIQRVVCGANYSTTCQDVVLALAHAMGRTGRFTLVEKWRESERPLTPTECPLQSLHKWGEYAPEVKFYLIQAQKSNHIQQTHHKTQTLDGGKKDSFGDKLSPRLSKYPGNPTGYESLKRSSTFSGAHGTNYTPSTLASSMSAAVSSYYAHNQESYEPPSSSSTPAAGKVRRTTLRSIPNGDVQNIPSNSSSQRTLRHPPGSSRAPLAPQADPNRGDARELHPANLPASSFKYPGRDFGASHQHKTSQLPSTVQHLNTAPHPVPTQHAHAPLKQKSPSASISHALQPSSQPSLVSSFQYSNSETNYPQQNSETNLPQKLNSQTSHSHQPFSKNNPAHNNDRPLPQPRHPQALQGGAEYENFNNNHQQHYPLPPQPRQRSKERLPAKLPEVSRQTHSSNTYDQHRSNTLDQHRSDPLDQLKSEAHDSFYSMDGSISSHVTERHNFKKRHENKTTREGSDNIISNRVTQGLTSRVDGYRHPIDDSEHPHKSATLERSVPQQRKSLPPTSRSQSVSGPEQNQPLDNPAASKSAVGHLRRSGDIGKLSFVESALMKNSKPATDGSKSGAKSSFASAVAHLRQHSAEGNLKPKTDPHVRQHSSDSSHTDASFQPGQEYSNKDKPDHGEPFNNAQHHQHPHHNISAHDTATLSSHSQISSSWHGSAFTEISIKRGSPSSPSFAPVPYNLDQANFSHSGNIVRNMTPSGAESHSREASLEIEEYDLDQRFPDVYHHEGGLKPVTVEYSLESGSVMPAKSEAEYLQLVRLVKMQQEKLEMQEAQINDSSTEITALEKQGSVDEGTLEVIVAEMSQLEKQESDCKLELDNLERVEWVNVLDGERKMEAKIKLQMSKLKEEIDQIERKLKELRAEEERLTREGQVERDKMAAKKSKAEEADKETSTRMGKLNNKLAILGKNIKENEAKLKDLESLISKTGEMLDNQKKQVEAMEEEVKYEEVQETQNHPLSEDATSPVNQITASQQSNRAASLSASDSGEAILKILEGRLSPHPYPDSLSNDHMTAAGQKFKSQLAAKNPNGVWV